ncbi:preprotein translocase subunit SecG [Porphyromonadaceae bacterium W3.11]|nr:preprotein translocase subunit SecG [Porphyromonadaceae bacterium W3.11]
MYIFLSILIALIAIALVFIVTIQNSKGGGLASGFSSSNNIMGVRRTTDLLEKVTWGLAVAMAVLCILAVRWAPRAANSGQDESVIVDYIDKATVPVPVEAQPFGDQPTTEDSSSNDMPTSEEAASSTEEVAK